MPRQLNKEIFGFSPKSEELSEESTKLLISELAYQIKLIKRQMKDSDKKQEQSLSKYDSLENKCLSLFHKSQTNISRLEKAMKAAIHSVFGKISKFNQLVATKHKQESQIQHMIDTHNITLQRFESKIHELEKVISKQELQLHNYQETIRQFQKKYLL